MQRPPEEVATFYKQRPILHRLRDSVVGLVCFANIIQRICGYRDRARSHIGREAQDIDDVLSRGERALQWRCVEVRLCAASRQGGGEVPASRCAAADICDIEFDPDYFRR